jgi:hypothetical protein
MTSRATAAASTAMDMCMGMCARVRVGVHGA